MAADCCILQAKPSQRHPKKALAFLTHSLIRACLRVFANSVDPDESAPVGAVLSGSTLFAKAECQLVAWL